MAARQRNRNSLEQKVQHLLDEHIPQAYLAGVQVFRPDKGILPDGMANEIDFLVHSMEGDTNVITIIECKNCTVTGAGGSKPKERGEWYALYPRRPKAGINQKEDLWQTHKQKPIKKQIERQWQALRHNIEPLEELQRIRLEGLVLSGASNFENEIVDDQRTVPLDPVFRLIDMNAFKRFLLKWNERQNRPLRVIQSEILRRLRCSKPLRTLGHPELKNAISYSLRSRKFIDAELFRHFTPTPGYWAINGSAGMGKSVLLAYSLQVFLTDRHIGEAAWADKNKDLFPCQELLEEKNVPPLEKRQIWVVCMNQKQSDTIKAMHHSIRKLYGLINPFAHYERAKPTYHLWKDAERMLDQCNVLLIDEAHDLPPEAQKRVREWYGTGKDRYLVVACDRHQKLRLLNESSRIIEGFNFGGHTVRLDRNYRNPFPCYFTAISLLFRWHARSGQKVRPSKEDLEKGLGLQQRESSSSNALVVSNRNDAHPANNWQHLVSMFPDPASAYNQIADARLEKEQVLWVRFSEENTSFDYECLSSSFTYHYLYGRDAASIIDKYIKGQEFPVVVIEGLPEDFLADQGHELRKGLVARRLVYLVASRATVFLYFVTTGSEPKALLDELHDLTSQQSKDLSSGRLWENEIEFGKATKALTIPGYLRILEPSYEADAKEDGTIDPEPEQIGPKPLTKFDKLLHALRPFGKKKVYLNLNERRQVAGFLSDERKRFSSSTRLREFLRNLKTALHITFDTQSKTLAEYTKKYGISTLVQTHLDEFWDELNEFEIAEHHYEETSGALNLLNAIEELLYHGVNKQAQEIKPQEKDGIKITSKDKPSSGEKAQKTKAQEKATPMTIPAPKRENSMEGLIQAFAPFGLGKPKNEEDIETCKSMLESSKPTALASPTLFVTTFRQILDEIKTYSMKTGESTGKHHLKSIREIFTANGLKPENIDRAISEINKISDKFYSISKTTRTGSGTTEVIEAFSVKKASESTHLTEAFCSKLPEGYPLKEVLEIYSKLEPFGLDKAPRTTELAMAAVCVLCGLNQFRALTWHSERYEKTLAISALIRSIMNVERRATSKNKAVTRQSPENSIAKTSISDALEIQKALRHFASKYHYICRYNRDLTSTPKSISRSALMKK